MTKMKQNKKRKKLTTYWVLQTTMTHQTLVLTITKRNKLKQVMIHSHQKEIEVDDAKAREIEEEKAQEAKRQRELE